jgi:hypothetical protein
VHHSKIGCRLAAMRHSRHSRYPGVSGLPGERSVFWAARPPGFACRSRRAAADKGGLPQRYHPLVGLDGVARGTGSNRIGDETR